MHHSRLKIDHTNLLHCNHTKQDHLQDHIRMQGPNIVFSSVSFTMLNEAKKTRRGQKSTGEEEEVRSDCENIPEPISEPLSVRLGTGRDEFFLRGGEFLQHKYLRLIHEANINAIWAFALFRACVNPISRGPLQCQSAPALYQSQESTPYSYTSSEKGSSSPNLVTRI